MNKIPVPKILGKIKTEKLRKIIKRKLPRTAIYLVDSEYEIIAKSEMERFLKEDKTNLIKYRSELQDCDDICWALLGSVSKGLWSGIAFGFAFSKVHAFCIFCNGKDIYIIEPQNDKIMTLREARRVKSGPNREVSPFWPIVLIMI